MADLLIPAHLSFIVYAASRGDFVLGGLQALFEHDLDKALREVALGESRCALDPVCTRHGGACVACLHVGEPSCRYYNQFLDRRSLFGAEGLLTVQDDGAVTGSPSGRCSFEPMTRGRHRRPCARILVTPPTRIAQRSSTH